MKFSITIGTLLLLYKIICFGTHQTPDDLGLYDLPRSCSSFICDFDGIHSARPLRGSINLGFVSLGTYYTDHYKQFAQAITETWHSVSFTVSAASFILVKQSCLTGKPLIHISLYKTIITDSNTNKKLTSSYLSALLIVIAHDTETNPGPTCKYPCQICKLACKWSQRGTRCDNCMGWYHVECMTMTTPSYAELDHSGYMWICHTCGIPNYSNISLSSSDPVELSNSFSTLLGNSSLDSDDFSPEHFSSPKNTKHKTSKNTDKIKGDLRTLVINFQGLRSKKTALKVCIDTHKPHVIIGTESWLDGDVLTSEIFPPNFNVFRKDRITTTSGGGVFVALRNDLLGTHQVEMNAKNESIWVNIEIAGWKNMLIGAFYQRPNEKSTQFLEELATSLTKASKRKKTTVCLGGDFNEPDIDWDTLSLKPGCKNPNVARKLLEIVHDFSLEQVVKEPTRQKNILDLFFTSNHATIQNSMVAPGVGDHDGIPVIDQSSRPWRAKVKPRLIHQYHKADVDQIKKEMKKLSDTIVDRNNAESTPDSVWKELKQGISETIQKHVPSKTVTKRHQSPWITRSIRSGQRMKQRYFNRARETNKDSDREKFNKVRKKVQKATKKSYYEYVRNTCLESRKQFWTFIKKMKTDTAGIQSLRDKGQLKSDAKSKADILNHQFESIFTVEDPLTKMTDNDQRAFPTMPDITVICDGVVKLLKNLKPNKATGPDGVPGQILKMAADELAPALTLLFNMSISTGSLPQDWLTANITPIYKKGDKATASNYRPVSLTSITCKLLEHILHSNIMKHLDKHNILTDKQHGFRAKHSCETQLLQTVHDFAHSLDKRKQTDIIIMDFSKAFDTVPHNRLLYKLRKYGISGFTHTWLTQFLTTRTQRVVVDGEQSDWVKVRSGVPQGTVLGPLLFLLYINDLPHNIKSQVRLFADDCVMYNTINNDNDSHTLQQDLHTLTQWQDNWQLKFNLDKCYVLKVTRSNSPKQHKYTLGTHTLQETKTHTYLGVELSGDLKWTNHINRITAKANRALGFIRRNLHPCPQDLKVTAYQTLVRPHLEYCSSVWDPHTQDLITKLESVQRRGARFVSNDYRWTSSVSKMLTKLNWNPLEHRRRASRLTMLHKISQGQVAIPAHKFIQPVQTRSSSRVNHSKAYTRIPGKSNVFNDSFFPLTILQWNQLPEHLINITNPDSFKSHVTTHINLQAIQQQD